MHAYACVREEHTHTQCVVRVRTSVCTCGERTHTHTHTQTQEEEMAINMSLHGNPFGPRVRDEQALNTFQWLVCPPPIPSALPTHTMKRAHDTERGRGGEQKREGERAEGGGCVWMQRAVCVCVCVCTHECASVRVYERDTHITHINSPFSPSSHALTRAHTHSRAHAQAAEPTMGPGWHQGASAAAAAGPARGGG